ncbi:hypothetical protein KJY77_00795 [Canibacter sp. lx-72]|nr:hypothetical protein [Canibacter zhuwentaonis]MBT1034839.1 hypothetical protein [Canibacter zhuwentaonis]
MVTKRDEAYTVRLIPAKRALKNYVCPGCGGNIAPGVAHTVAWRSDYIMGDSAAIAERRHWHLRCWNIF